MEADWTETTRISLPSAAPSYASPPVTTFAFDPLQDLLWVGDENGRVTSFYGPELQRYTSYKGHVSRDARVNAPVRQLLCCDTGIISVSDESVHLSSRNGITQWHISLPDMQTLRCMSFTGRGTGEVVAAGCQEMLYRVDVERGIVTESFKPSTVIAFTLMRRCGHYICAASHDGSIHILDIKTLSVINTWKAYAGTVNDMDARGDYLLTCGWAQRHYQGPVLEQLVRVYDLKLQKPAPPISFPPGAAYVRMHPKLSSTCMVISQTGAIYSIDVLNPDAPVMRFTSPYEAHFTGLELMPSGNGFALSDSNHQIILWGSPTKTHFVEYAKPTEFAESVSQTAHLEWSDNFNLIGMPYYRHMLLSVWSNSLVHEVGLPTKPLDTSITLQKLPGSITGEVGAFPRKTRRNEVNTIRPARRGGGKLATPKFLSEKPSKHPEHDVPRRLSEDVAKTLAELTMHGDSPSLVPAWYQVVEIKYSKFGVEDFDFGYYNETEFSGLETHIVNSYSNALLQLLRFTPVVRNLALHHTARECGFETCILCELGFLFDMLEKAKGKSCQATNFLKTLSKHSNAAALGILEEHTMNIPLTVMVQNLNRFLLTSIEENYLAAGAAETAFSTTGHAFSRCGHCSYEASQPKVWYTHDLVYPTKYHKAPRQQMLQRFSHILKSSVERYDQQRGWCSNCQGYKPITSRRVVQSVPAVLSLNAAVHSQDARQLWSTPGFLPAEIGIIVKDGQFFCYEGQDLKSHLQRRAFDIVVYELVGTVADIALGDSKKSHVISLIDTAISDINSSETGAWHLLNDFLVRKTPTEDAFHFDQRWKLPSVLMYQVKTMSHKIDESWKAQIDTNVLFRSVTQPKFTDESQFLSLQQTEALPGLSSHCAIDAEFVRLLREEIDVGADGTRTITRPHRSGLARVSVLRGDEPRQGVPFVDDYICIDEPIDDYLTEYSGLKPGDLTLGRSRYTLVNLHTVYKKLWVLLNLGVQFIGHGLKSDFRIINMHVPENQVIDTQELFSLGSRARRKLSLRFLAWLILKEDIQQNSEEGHDSIEDAQTALKLWRKYLEYMDAGILENMIDEIWVKGKAYDFKVPAERDRSMRNSNSASASGSAPGTPLRVPVSLAKITSPLR